MKHYFVKIFAIICLISTTQLLSKKAMYDGFGKVSKSTGRIKTKSTKGYFKPSNGYKYVNSYSRS